MFPLFVIWKIRGSLAEPSLIWLTVLSFVDGSDFARVFLVVSDECELASEPPKPVRFKITETTRQSLECWIADPEVLGLEYLWPSRFHHSVHLSTRQYAPILRDWITSVGLEPSAYGTHSMRRTKVAQI